MDEQKNNQPQDILIPIDQPNGQPQEQQETAAQKRLRYMTDEERREWSGLSEWKDPLEKEKPEQNENNGKLALASLLCGIAGALIACIHISSLIFGIAAVVCGILSKKKGESASTMSTIGIVLGCICFGLFLWREVLWVLGRMFPPENVNPANIPSDLASEIN